jgi:superfamily II DNA helicase RecQ
MAPTTMSNPYQLFDFESFFRDVAFETNEVFKVVIGKTPYDYQARVRRALAVMSHPQHPSPKSSVLLVQPTGGGKTCCNVSHSLILAGFSLTIVPLLSLGVDQEEKLKRYPSDASKGIINPIHLDDYRSAASQRSLVNDLLLIETTTQQTFLLFSSPQAIVGSKPFQELIQHLIKTKLLRMICVDELHLYVQFGLSFRDEFRSLTKYLFDLIRINRYTQQQGKRQIMRLSTDTTVPILWMTATASDWIIKELEDMTGISISHDSNNVFWPDAKGMYKPTVSLDLLYSDQPLRKFKERVFPVLAHNRLHKYIWYTNNLYTLEQNIKNALLEIDSSPDVKADLIRLSGADIKEQKMWHLVHYCRNNSSNIPTIDTCAEDERPLNPQLLMATSGAANAGIDCDQIHGVGRGEFPPSLRDLTQEMGRAGRWPNSIHDGVWYLACLSIESLSSLIRRTFRSKQYTRKSYYLAQLQDINDVLDTLVLPTKCLHSQIAEVLQNPYKQTQVVLDSSCGNNCSFCRDEYKKLFPPIDRLGLSKLLMDIFLNKRHLHPILTIDDTLVSVIKQYKDDDGVCARKLIFGSAGRAENLRPIEIKKVIITCIASGIIGFDPKFRAEETTREPLNATTNSDDQYDNRKIDLHALLLQTSDSANLRLHSDNSWIRIRTK